MIATTKKAEAGGAVVAEKKVAEGSKKILDSGSGIKR